MTKTRYNPKDDIGEYGSSRIQISHNGRQAGLVKVTRLDDKVNQVIEDIRNKTPFIRERGEIGHGGFDIGSTSLGGELGS